MRFYKHINENVLDDVLDTSGRYLYHWKNKWIINTKHGIQRIAQRNKLSGEQLKKLFKETIEKSLEMGVHVGEKILFYSKSLKQGFVSAIDGQGNIDLVTFLPRGHHIAKTPGHEDTEHVVLEGTQYRIIEVD